jgi:hypothetical protein
MGRRPLNLEAFSKVDKLGIDINILVLADLV